MRWFQGLPTRCSLCATPRRCNAEISHFGASLRAEWIQASFCVASEIWRTTAGTLHSSRLESCL